MYNLTKLKIKKPAHVVFEAFVDPAHIKNFWFDSSSRWEQGTTVTLRYEEYDAQIDIELIEVEVNKKIVFRWGGEGEAGNIVTISLNEMDSSRTIIEVREDGFREDDDELISILLDNKGGWVYMLTCLKGYLEFGINKLRAAIVH
ncbi:SRPBCC family protein [Neobacillus drentensis]|uniref:SRPBCC family protein n=1 Tax=Neobacillus drentensis TaxID=220684 RepID=UPI000823F9B2|nr:SRPBCC family protein [Neobacillus drentensis]